MSFSLPETSIASARALGWSMIWASFHSTNSFHWPPPVKIPVRWIFRKQNARHPQMRNFDQTLSDPVGDWMGLVGNHSRQARQSAGKGHGARTHQSGSRRQPFRSLHHSTRSAQGHRPTIEPTSLRRRSSGTGIRACLDSLRTGPRTHPETVVRFFQPVGWLPSKSRGPLSR